VSSLKRRKEIMGGRGGSACGYVTKDTAKGVEEKSSTCPITKGTGALWRRHSRQGIPVRARVAYEGGNSIVCGM